MAEDNEFHFSSLTARIAALKGQGIDSKLESSPFTGKKHLPPSKSINQIPALPPRSSKTTDKPSIINCNPSTVRQPDDSNSRTKVKVLLPPPPIEKEKIRGSLVETQTASFTQRDSPALPARKPSSQPLKNEKSTELQQPVELTGSNNIPRRLPPRLEKDNNHTQSVTCRGEDFEPVTKKMLALSIKSTPTPKLPPRSLPTSNRNSVTEVSQKPKLPSRPAQRAIGVEKRVDSMEPPKNSSKKTTKSALSMGFNSKSESQEQEAVSSCSSEGGGTAQELTTENFDSEIQGKLAFVKFYRLQDWNCQKVEPIWRQLIINFAFASDRIIFAQVNLDLQTAFQKRYDISLYPTMIFFNEDEKSSEKFIFEKSINLEVMTDFVEIKSGVKMMNSAPNLSNPTPPINHLSKPSTREIQSRKTTASHHQYHCLRCRDFSGPDTVASRYPRHSIPKTHDTISFLATSLCGPFTSETDKARAIFTWLHHNIAYDVEALFGNRIKNMQPGDTITSGLAVCSGYAGVFEAIALKAGLQVITITGHGKGLGYQPIKNGDPIPLYNPSGHAWNSVRIDQGEWKLIDSCWGAGNVNGRTYTKSFAPREFTRSNEEFGISHFPQNPRHFYRSDGLIPSWEQYIRGLGPTDEEPLQEFGNVDDDYGISLTSFVPPQKYVSLQNITSIRFQFSKVCEYFNEEKHRNRLSYLFLLCIHGSNDQWFPFDNNGYWWWLDVPTKSLTPGQKVGCFVVTKVDGKEARGMTKEEYLEKKGRLAMNFSGVSAWELV